MIEKDMMQDVDKNESDNHATKNDPPSIKVLVTDYTNDETLDDNYIQIRLSKAGRVLTPTVTGEID